jgi:predicted ATPase/class 3 adenylate cyclase
LATVLFADLAGFTSMSEGMDPEAVKALAARCAAVMSEEVKRFGGVVSTVLGDALMAVFGAPVAHEDDAERAVRAAVSMRDRIASVQDAPKPLELHVGINTGETIVGMIGPEEARDYTAMGDTTNTAARLMSAAPAGSVFVGEKTYQSTQEAVTYRDIGTVAAKGKSLSVRAWEVLDLSTVPSTRSLGTAPLIGREEELRALRKLWDGVLGKSTPAIGIVLGPPGFGKSRLLDEFAAALHDARRVHRGRCLSYGEGITYWPVVEILNEAIGILHGDNSATVSEKTADFLDALSPADADQRQTLRIALGALMGVQPAEAEGEITQGELHWGIRRILELLAEPGPIALVVEDVHWAEPTLLDLLEYVARSPRAPILLLLTGRPEVEEAWPGGLEEDAQRTIIHLRALTEMESDQVLASLMPVNLPTEGPVAAVLRRAAGVPLFLEETVRMLTEMGALDSTRGAPGDGGLTSVVPSSIQGLIGSRLDLLPFEDRQIAQFASVVGNTFWAGAVAHLLETDEGLVDALDRLGGKDIVKAHEPSGIAWEREYMFVHMLIRDVAYARLPKQRRSELHLRCSEWISGLPASDESFIEINAFHLETACNLVRELGPSVQAPVVPAIEALARAAEKAERREGISEADRFYARALELVDGDLVERAAELRVRRSRTLTALGRLHDASQLLDTVTGEAELLERLDLKAAALVGLANIDQKQGRVSEARQRLDEAQAIGAKLNDVRLQIRTAYELSSLRSRYANEVQAAEDLKDAQRLAEVLNDRPLRVEGHLRMGTLLFNLGQLAQAEEELLRCLVLARESGSVRDDARATHFLALVEYYQGEYEEAERHALRAAEWLERTGDRYLQTQNLGLLGKLALTAGDYQLARERLNEALGFALDSGTPWLVVEVNRYLTQALLRQGRRKEAREAARAAAESLPEEDLYARSAVLLAEALVATADEDRDAAIGKFEEALPLLVEQRLIIDLAEARIEFARVLRHLGEVERADRELRFARETLSGTDARGLLGSIAREMLEISEDASRATEVGGSS